MMANRHILIWTVTVLSLAAFQTAQAQTPIDIDVLLKGGTIYDGTGGRAECSEFANGTR